MKDKIRIILMVIAIHQLSFVFSQNLTDYQSSICGTKYVNPDINFQIASRREKYKFQLINGKDYSIINIPIALHVIINEDNEGILTEEQINDQIDTLNNAFDKFNFNFYLSSLDVTENPDWFDCNNWFDWNPMKNNLAISPELNLNLYTVGNISDPINSVIDGISWYPDDYEENDYRHGVIVRYRRFPGLSPGFPYNEGNVVVHEVGHYLGLLHTFESGCVNGPNVGDKCEDTPAQDDGDNVKVCVEGYDSCEEEPGLDPIHNYMNYTTDDCRTEFTIDQTTRSRTELEDHKPTLINASSLIIQNVELDKPEYFQNEEANITVTLVNDFEGANVTFIIDNSLPLTCAEQGAGIYSAQFNVPSKIGLFPIQVEASKVGYFNAVPFNINLLIVQSTFFYNGQVDPPQGNTNTNFLFSIYFKDLTNQPPQYVKVIGSNWDLPLVANGTNYSNGVLFTGANIFTSPGTYSYYYEAKSAEGETIRWPVSSDLNLNVIQSAVGWEIRVTNLTASPTYMINGGNVTSTATVHNNSNSPDKIYYNVPYKFEMISPSGNVFDQEFGNIPSLTQSASVPITKTLTTESTLGTYSLVFSIQPLLDNDYLNNSMSKAIIVGQEGPSHQFYVDGADASLLIGNPPYPNCYTFKGDQYCVTQITSSYIKVSRNGASALTINKYDFREYNSGEVAVIVEGINTIGTDYAILSFGSQDPDYVEFPQTQISCFRGDQISFEANCSENHFTNGTPDFYKNLYIDDWFNDVNLENSNHTAYYEFDIPSNASYGEHSFFIGCDLSGSNEKFLRQLIIKVIEPNPLIINLDKYSFSADDQLIITGTNLGTTPGNVKFFDNLDGAVNSWNDNQIQCIVPHGIQSGNLYIVNNIGSSNGISYNVISSTGDPVIIQPIPDQEMNQSDTMVVANLNNTFWDPNNDPLTYLVELSSPNIAYIINNEELSLITNEVAESSIQIIVSATDLTNATVSDTFLIQINQSFPYILVQSPNGGEEWTCGQQYLISWSDNIMGNVNIDLFIGNQFDSQIAHNVSGNNYPWSIPVDQSIGTEYRVKITSSDNETIYDYSNNYFTIKENGFRLAIKVMLEGAYDSINNIMTTKLNPDNLPFLQPYNISPWNYNGLDSIPSIPNENVVDWVLVELRETSGGAASATENKKIAQKAGLLLNSANIVDPDGSNPLKFDLEITNNLFIIVWHRNHLGIMSAIPAIEINGIYNYDFTTGSHMAYGGMEAQHEVAPSIWAMIGADGDANGIIDNLDKNIWTSQVGKSGLHSGDYNLNGEVENEDKNGYWYPNIGKLTFVPQEANFICGDQFLDERDGHTYGTVLIDQQCWMSENLKIGDQIDGLISSTDNDTIEKYCWFDNPNNCDLFGGLYTWDEMLNYSNQQGSNGICPNGWHIPTDEEWMVLEGFVDSQYNYPDPIWNSLGWRGNDDGLKLKSVDMWTSGNGTDNFGFRVLPAGFRDNDNDPWSEQYNGGYTFFWTSDYIGDDAYYRWFDKDHNNSNKNYVPKTMGLSVRCIKDN